MKLDRVKGVHRYRHPKSGLWYAYHRKTGQRLAAPWKTAAFWLEVDVLDKKVAKAKAADEAKGALPGSLGLVIEAFRLSPNWAVLSPKTRLGYDNIFTLLKPLHAMPIRDVTRPFVLKLRDDKIFPKHGVWTANYTVVVLGLVTQYAADRGLIDANPLAEKVRRLRQARATDDKPARNRPWTREECAAVLAAAKPQIKLPIALAMFGGFRKTDILAMKRNRVAGGDISIRTSKRGVPVNIPMHPELAAAIAQAPVHIERLCVNSYGEPWSESGWNASFFKFIARLEVEGVVGDGLTLHGLRHTLGTRLKEAGASDQQIADVLGQRSTSMARHYSDNAELPAATRAFVSGAAPHKVRLKVVS